TSPPPRRTPFPSPTLFRSHWTSSAVSLVGLLLFAITGLTLNHAADIEGQPIIAERSAQLPPPLVRAVASGPPEGRARLPRPVARSEEHTSELQSRENLVCR